MRWRPTHRSATSATRCATCSTMPGAERFSRTSGAARNRRRCRSEPPGWLDPQVVDAGAAGRAALLLVHRRVGARRSSSASRSSGSAKTAPMLATTARSSPLIGIGSRKTSSTLLTSVGSRSRSSGPRTSPRTRRRRAALAVSSSAGGLVLERDATASSTASPAPCPSRSLMSLNESTSMNITRISAGLRSRRAGSRRTSP